MSNAKCQIRADVAPEQKEWLHEQGPNLSQTIRAIIDRAMPGGDLASKIDDDRPPQIRFLSAVEEYYRFGRSCDVAGVNPADITEALEADPLFQEAYRAAQRRFIEDIEFLLLDAAKGNRKIDKSAMTGLIAFLNNNHPAWGRIKAEMIQRIFGPLMTDMLKAAQELIDARTYKKLVAKWESIREMRLLPFSD